MSSRHHTSIVEEKMGKKPFEALGITEEYYMSLKESSRYTMLCDILRYNGLSVRKTKKIKEDNIPYITSFKKFLAIASYEDRDSILSLIDDVLSKDRQKEQIMAEIEVKKREIKELEFRLNN